jgi:hypothetical protein
MSHDDGQLAAIVSVIEGETCQASTLSGEQPSHLPSRERVLPRHNNMKFTAVLTFLAFGALASAAPLGCSNYMRVQSNVCAEACLGNSVGICPISIIVKVKLQGYLHRNCDAM